VLVVYLRLLAAPADRLMFSGLGVAVWSTFAVVIYGVVRRSKLPRSHPREDQRLEWFLVVWLILELVAYFGISPFPAARRVMGVIVVLTLLVARFARQTGVFGTNKALVYAAATGSILLGLGYHVTDYYEAHARRDVVQLAQAAITLQEPNATIWYAGHWGFQFYAERAGMMPLVPDGSHVKEGDCLVIPVDGVHGQAVQFGTSELEFMATIVGDDALPLSTVPSYYRGDKPLEHRREPRVELAILRARKDCMPTSPGPRK
jgi:hypothetical protein